jgi:hypothetical protein
MEFIQHSIDWCRGEIFEGKMVALFGLIVLLASMAHWRMGTTPAAKAMIIPLAILAIILISGGSYMVYSNNQRIKVFSTAFESNPTEFVEAEAERTEDFIKWYPYTMFITSGIIIIGLLLYLFWAGPYGRAIGMTIFIMGLAVLYIDHFSEERAHTYQTHISTYK